MNLTTVHKIVEASGINGDARKAVTATEKKFAVSLSLSSPQKWIAAIMKL